MASTESHSVASGLLSESELREWERRYPNGVTSADIVAVFAGRGVRFSEATLRKYVQQGLLPRSQRVGQKGKHKGSKGIYPTRTIRQINEIKRLMAMDYTIEEIAAHFAFVDGDIEELKALIQRIVERLEQSRKSAASDGLVTPALDRQLEEAKSTAQSLIEQLERVVVHLRRQAHLAKSAV